MANNTDTTPVFGVSEAIAYINQTLEYAYPSIVVEGEVASFKVNQNKYVFFDVKDEGGTLGCFMSVFQLRTQLEDGMKVRVVARPGLTTWGKFSLTVRDIQPVGEGSLKRAFELLRAKLEHEGLFAPERKRPLPSIPTRIGVISSTAAAGYGDFVKILGERWGGVELIVAHVQVQGVDAPKQMVRALRHFNEMAEPVDVVAIVRGGGSADDLSAFNDEPLVRAIAASRAPTIVGVGHEQDVTLADMAADVRAATPSNAAQLLVPDRREVVRSVRLELEHAQRILVQGFETYQKTHTDLRQQLVQNIGRVFERTETRYAQLAGVLSQLDPRAALNRGYALVFDESGKPLGDQPIRAGQQLRLETKRYIVTAGVTHAKEKNRS